MSSSHQATAVEYQFMHGQGDAEFGASHLQGIEGVIEMILAKQLVGSFGKSILAAFQPLEVLGLFR